ncbi:MAG: hypothetical protein ABSB63_16295 [Spirochaetia bacterium]
MNNGRDVARNHANALLIFCLLAMASGGGRLFAADVFVPPKEAPTTIFSTKLGSADVDLSLLGSWTAGVSFGAGLLLAPGLPAQALDSFPAIDQGFIFSQTPDITITLELLKRFYLNVSVLGNFSNNTIQLGYKGAPNEPLQSVVVGNTGVAIPSSQLVQIPSQPFGSLGAMSQFTAGGATNDVMLRWDPAQRKTKTFIGKNELVEKEIGLDTYVRGRYFFLPDVGIDTGSIQVFLEDPTGTYLSAADGRKYRLATYDEVVADSTNGLVSLRNVFKGRVLVYYKKNNFPVGNTAIGTPGLPAVTFGIRDLSKPSIPFSWTAGPSYPTYLGLDMIHRQVHLTVLNADCLLLWEPGDNSPFEMDNSYAFSSSPPSDVSKISYRFNAKTVSASLPGNLIFQSIPADTRFMVLVDRNFTGTNRFANFFPFENSSTDPNGLLYGPNRDSLSGSLPFDIFYQFLSPVSDLTLEANLVPGSVQVQVNGTSETRIQVEPVSGKLTILTDILPTDRIDVSYSVTEQGNAGGDILFAWRDKIPLSDSVNLSFTTGIRWNANPWTFSQTPYSKSGTIIATAGIDGKSENLSYSAEAGVAYTNPDTTGILRLFGMEGNSTSVDLSEENAFPASAPGIGEGLGGTTTQFNRGFLYYRDYRIYGALGSTTLQTIDAPTPALTPYANGSRMGPYNVTGSDGSLNPINLVMEYKFDANGQWVGTQLPISPGSDADLSGARAVTIRLRGLNLSSGSNVSVSLQIGSISEDLDSSGVLKAEVSSSDAGFPFVDQAHPGTVLKVGAGPQLLGNGRLDSEDRNGNTILDLEDPTRIFTSATPAISISSGSLNSTWANFTYTLSDSDRQKLMQARDVRIIVQETGGSIPAAGEILIDSITIEGTPFWPQTTGLDNRNNVHVQEVTESLALVGAASGGDLATKYPDTYKRFHSQGEPNQVLETSWTGLTAPFTVQGFVPQGTGGIQYNTIVSYFRSPTAASYTFSLLDNSTPPRGVSWNISVADNVWHEIRVSKNDNTVRMDGNVIGTPAKFDSSYRSLSQLTVSVSGSPATPPAGFLYIDEIYCTDPQGDVGVAFVGNLSAKFPGTVLASGNVPILSNVAIRQDVSLISAGFAPLYGVPSPSEDLSSRTQADADIFFVRTNVDLQLREAAGSFSAAGAHKVMIPTVASPVTVTDAFSLNWAGGFSRENTLVLTPGSFLTLTLDTSANAQPDVSASTSLLNPDAAVGATLPSQTGGIGTGLLNQSWQASLALNPFSPLTVSSNLSLSQALEGYVLPTQWYGASWAREASLVMPWDGGTDVLRSEQLGFKAGIPASPFGFSLEAQGNAARSADSTLTGLSQENDTSLSMALLLNLPQGGGSDMSMSLAYKRYLSLTTSPLPGPRFSSEADEYFNVLSSQAYLLNAVPFTELLTNNSARLLADWQSAGATQGIYSPSVVLSFQRSFGARIIDLFVPSTAEIAVGQDFKKTADLSQTTMYFRPKIGTRAVNLFGALGVYPLLPMVRTDEYSLSMSASVDGGPGLPTRLSTLSAETFASLTGEKDSALTLVNTLRMDRSTTVTGSAGAETYTLSNDSQVLLEWSTRPSGGVILPLLSNEIGKTGYFAHRESVDITEGYINTGAYHPFTLVLGHSSAIVYEGHGSIKATINLGMDAENVGVGIAWRLAFRAALEAKLTF